MSWVSALALFVGGGIVITTAIVVGTVQAGMNRRQQRLISAFRRAKRAEGAGTGEQGDPHSVYSRQMWEK